MAGNPQDCRLQAEACLRLAQDAADQEGRALLSSIADQWMRLAKDYENADAFIEAMRAINQTTPTQPVSMAVDGKGKDTTTTTETQGAAGPQKFWGKERIPQIRTLKG